VRVRKALSLTINRKRLCDEVIISGEEPAHAFSPPDPNGFTSTTRYEYDPEAARKLLAEAGYPDGDGFPAVEILYNTQENHKLIAEVIQEMWNRELNIQVDLINQDWKVYLSTRRQLDYDVARAGWIGDYTDPVNFLECMETGNGNNNTGWSNAEYDATLAAARRATTNEERFALYQKCEDLIADEMPIIPIYQYVRRMLVSGHVEGWIPNLRDHRFYQGMSLKPVE
jgi:oligopeptide transport system substrate-binding protein